MWEIYNLSNSQVTETAMAEPLICVIKRAVVRGKHPESPSDDFFHLWHDMVEDGFAQLV